MDPAQLSQLPLNVLVIIGAYWVIQRHNDEYAKKLIELIAQFTSKYQEYADRANEERKEARERWVERDRQLIETLIGNQKALLENAQQNHSLRSALQPLVLWWQSERQDAPHTRHGGGNANAAD